MAKNKYDSIIQGFFYLTLFYLAFKILGLFNSNIEWAVKTLKAILIIIFLTQLIKLTKLLFQNN